MKMSPKTRLANNPLEEIVYQIMAARTTERGNVTPDARVYDRSTHKKRQVDVLLEDSPFQVRVRIAVECRDRRGAEDVEWIDSLAGRDLDVDKTVAVSASRFTATALTKSAAKRIECRLLSAVSPDAFPKQLVVPQFLFVTEIQLHLQNATVTLDKCEIPSTDGGVFHDDIRAQMIALYEAVLTRLTERVSANIHRFAKTHSDTAQRTAIDLRFAAPHVLKVEGREVTGSCPELRVEVAVRTQPVMVSHYQLDSSIASCATVVNSLSRAKKYFIAVQNPDRPLLISTAFTPFATAPKRTRLILPVTVHGDLCGMVVVLPGRGTATIGHG